MSASHGRHGPVAVLISDVYFATMVASTARKLDIPVSFVSPGEPIPQDARLAIVDLQFPADWESAVREYANGGGEVVGFGPHVQGSLMKRARAAGCQRVMAKSKFVEEIPTIVASAQASSSTVSPSSLGPQSR